METVPLKPAMARSIVWAIVLFVLQAVPTLIEVHGTDSWGVVLKTQISAFVGMLCAWVANNYARPSVTPEAVQRAVVCASRGQAVAVPKVKE